MLSKTHNFSFVTFAESLKVFLSADVLILFCVFLLHSYVGFFDVVCAFVYYMCEIVNKQT